MTATQILPFPSHEFPAEVLEQAAGALERGEIVAVPTETVYGLAVRADQPEALASLAQLKGRGAEIPFTWHAPHAERMLQAGPEQLLFRSDPWLRWWSLAPRC